MRNLRLQLNVLHSPLLHLILFSASPAGFHPYYATETLSRTLLTPIIYQIQWPTPSPPHTWSLGSMWQSWPLPHYWHTLIYSVYETSHWFLYFFLNDCLPLQASHLYVREPWISFGIFFSIYSHSLHNLF